MRILFACNSQARGGAESYVSSLAAALASRGHYVCVAAAAGSDLGRLAADTAGVTALVMNIGPKLSRRSAIDMALRFPMYRRALQSDLKTWVEQHGIEILHLQFKKEQIIASSFAKRLGLAVVWTEHDRIPAALASFRPGLRLYRTSSESADRIICVADFVRENLISHGLSADRTAVCHNGIDPLPTVSVSRDALRDQLGLDRHSRVVATASRLAWTKGVGDFLAAATLVREEFDDIQFLVVGDGPERDELQQKASKLGLSKHVVFAGHRNDVPAILESIDIFTCPSLQEGFPFSILEAMRAGKPVVATRTGGVPELLRHSVDGFLVEVGDVVGLAAAIARLLRDGDLRSRFGESGRRHVFDNFTAKMMIDRTESVFQDALSDMRASRGEATRKRQDAVGRS